MVDRRNISYIKAMQELYARISSQRVLCIDDNPYFREFVCWFISDVGCEVSEAARAGDAIALIEPNPGSYDLLILADWLPDMDGVEVLRRLRSIPYAGRIAVTAPQQLPPDQKAIYNSLGVSAILTTPIGYSELMRILEPVVGESSIAIQGRPEKASIHANLGIST
jgi:two-component system, chemotaxis family, chemotaxis protein CheY